MKMMKSIRKDVCYDIKEEFKTEIIEYLQARSTMNLAGAVIKEWDDADEFDKMLYYWLYGELTGAIDCDASSYIMELYKNTYPHIGGSWSVESCYPGKEKIKRLVCREEAVRNYCGETMTSAWVMVKAYLDFLWHSHEELRKKGEHHFEENKKGDLSCTGFKKVYDDRGYSNKGTWVLHLIRFGDVFKPYFSEGFKRFLRLNHTEGNMLPVPPYFNAERAGKYARWDQADLMLTCIYNWDQHSSEVGDEPLYLLFSDSGKIEKAVKSCKVWLEQFPSWDAFVENHYLQSFTETACNGGIYGAPKPLWTGHDFDQCVPRDGTCWNEFFENCSRSIEQRGKTIDLV